MKDEYLYLLINNEATAFKIGISIDPVRRSARLPQEINLGQSLQIAIQDGSARKVEGVLHYLFRSYSKEMPRGEGYTEWFSMEAWDAVLSYLSDNRSFLGTSDPTPIQVDCVGKRKAGASKGELEAKRLEREKEQARKLEESVKRAALERECAEANNKKVLETVRNWVDANRASILGIVLRENHPVEGESQVTMVLREADASVLDDIFSHRNVSTDLVPVPVSRPSGEFIYHRGMTLKVFPSYHHVKFENGTVSLLSLDASLMSGGDYEIKLYPRRTYRNRFDPHDQPREYWAAFRENQESREKEVEILSIPWSEVVPFSDEIRGILCSLIVPAGTDKHLKLSQLIESVEAEL